MFTKVLTWVGPADKIVVDGDFWRWQFVDQAKYEEWIESFPGAVKGSLEQDLSVPGIVVRTQLFETEQDARNSLLTDVPDSLAFSEKALADMYLYQNDNKIMRKVKIIPA